MFRVTNHPPPPSCTLEMGCGLGFVCWSDGCGAAEATGLSFVCFVAFNSCALSANRVDFGLLFYYFDFIFFLFHKFSNLTPIAQAGQPEEVLVQLWNGAVKR